MTFRFFVVVALAATGLTAAAWVATQTRIAEQEARCLEPQIWGPITDQACLDAPRICSATDGCDSQARLYTLSQVQTSNVAVTLR